jgi:hypothetical protein|eukprot:g7087.t1
MSALAIEQSGADIIAEEMLVLRSMYVDKFNTVTPRRLQIEVDLCDKTSVTVEFLLTKDYPRDPATMRFVDSSLLPKNIVQSALDVSILEATENVNSPMLYTILTRVVDMINAKLASLGEETPKKDGERPKLPSPVRLVADKNSKYYFGEGAHSELGVLRRQLTEDIPHFSARQFEAAGFIMYSNDSQSSYNVWTRKAPEMVIIHEKNSPEVLPLEVTADGISPETVGEWIELFISQYTCSGTGDLLQSLVQWVSSCQELDQADRLKYDVGEAPVNLDVDPNADYNLEKLPSVQEMEELIGMSISTGRGLQIITWGDKKVKLSTVKQLGSTANFNAKPLDGRGSGADLRVNATQDPQIVRNVVSSMTRGVGALWLQRAVERIERGNMNTVSTFCSQGRHRSVSSALILKYRYYPNATFRHLKMR